MVIHVGVGDQNAEQGFVRFPKTRDLRQQALGRDALALRLDLDTGAADLLLPDEYGFS